MKLLRRIYHNIFHRWAVVEVQDNGTIQILSTHMSQDVARSYCNGSAWKEFVITTESALARIERG